MRSIGGERQERPTISNLRLSDRLCMRIQTQADIVSKIIIDLTIGQKRVSSKAKLGNSDVNFIPSRMTEVRMNGMIDMVSLPLTK